MARANPYRFDLALPDGYQYGTEQYPLLLFLHGRGERGDDLTLVRRHGPPKLIRGLFRPLYLDPFIILSPQCPADAQWSALALAALLDELLPGLRVDRQRMYLTGISMGGYGAWSLALHRPERFAAVAPICGGGDPALAARLEPVAVWIFHSAGDEVVPVVESDRMFEALARSNANVTYTRYRSLSHVQTWEEAYGEPLLYEWFLRQTRPRS